MGRPGWRDEVPTGPRSRAVAAAATARGLARTQEAVWSGLSGEPRHADRPPTAEEARAVLAASLGLDAGELGGLSAAGAERALARLNELVRRLAEQAAVDELTGALRRGAGYAAARAEIERARRTGSSLALVVVDVDGLKRVNDRQGHLGGDRVLRDVAQELAAAMRPYDVLIRFGGDEFVCVLGGVHRAQGRRRIAGVQERLRARGISISAGLAELRGGDGLDTLIRRADSALYAGRARRRPASDPGTASGRLA